jgi:tetratricopeptide (TPR) repeat protein
MNVPENARRELNKGEDAAFHGDNEQARKHFEKALALHANFAAALNDLGVLAMKSGDRERGREYFRRAVAADDRYLEALVNLSKVEFEMARYADCEPLLVKAAALSPTDPQILTMLATSELINGKIDAAIVTAQRVYLMPHQRYAIAHFIAARGYQVTNRLFEAQREYETFLKESPTGSNAELARQSLAQLQAQPGSGPRH